MTITQPLDLHRIFVENFAGSGLYFFLLSLIAIAYGAARFRMTGVIFGAMIVLFATMFAGAAYPIFSLIILVLGIAIFIIVGRIVK